MYVPKVNTIDFETRGIKSRPAYPPEPVGVSIKRWGNKARYYSFGHPTNNNCTKEEAVAALVDIWYDELPMLFFNGKFDVDVAQTHMGMKDIDWDKIHDAQYQVFLLDPHAISLALKASAERMLGIPPTERDAVREWLYKNVPETRGQKGKSIKEWGAFIWMAPGDLVGKYANMDTGMTEALYKHCYPKILEEGMLPAYDRERQLMPIFLENERKGLRVDLKALKRDIPIYKVELEKAERWICKQLGVKYGEINIDSDDEMAELLDNAGIVTEWVMTKTGKRSTSKKNMTIEMFTDKKFFLVLGYRNRLTTCLRMFMENWYEKGSRNGGYIQPTWNQVRQPKGTDGSRGTRTGRPSCEDPNLLNVSKAFEDRGDDYTHPKFLKLLELPLTRKYLLPDEGCIFLHRDYNQQELRFLAHFEDGDLLAAYKKDPKMDVHNFIQEAVKRIIHKFFDRVSIKTTVFGRIYGQGLGGLAQKLKVTIDEVKEVRDAQNKALPGLPELDKSIKNMAKAGEPIVTWGGRVYHCEKPKYVEKFKREMTFEYKLLNYLIQGSAADATKEAIIRWYNHPKRSPLARFLVTVYDEINICAPKNIAKEQMEVLRECMESIEVDVPLLTDGKAGTAWGNLEKVAW